MSTNRSPEVQTLTEPKTGTVRAKGVVITSSNSPDLQPEVQPRAQQEDEGKSVEQHKPAELGGHAATSSARFHGRGS